MREVTTNLAEKRSGNVRCRFEARDAARDQWAFVGTGWFTTLQDTVKYRKRRGQHFEPTVSTLKGCWKTLIVLVPASFFGETFCLSVLPTGCTRAGGNGERETENASFIKPPFAH